MISYEQALQCVRETVRPLPSVKLPLLEAAGQVLAAPACARWDMPRWDNAAMDGFALAAEALLKGEKFPVLGAAFAGKPYERRLPVGAAIRITTGAPLPEGADCVVPLEDTKEESGEVVLQQRVSAGQHVRYRGEEFRTDELLLAAGEPLHAGAIGLLASAGVAQVEVIRRPRVAIFSTGDELVELGREPAPGQIVNSNLPYLIARVQECGAIPIPLGIGEDFSESLELLIAEASGADLIISTGGVSVGEKDLVQQALVQRGFERKFWKVAIKPGKPVLFGLLQGKPFLGLPGNPAATAATFELFAVPALRRLAGRNPENGTRRAVLEHDIKSSGNRQAFLWCHCQWQDGSYRVWINSHQGSGQTRNVQQANALLSIPPCDQQLAAGSAVEIILIER